MINDLSMKKYHTPIEQLQKTKMDEVRIISYLSSIIPERFRDFLYRSEGEAQTNEPLKIRKITYRDRKCVIVYHILLIIYHSYKI